MNTAEYGGFASELETKKSSELTLDDLTFKFYKDADEIRDNTTMGAAEKLLALDKLNLAERISIFVKLNEEFGKDREVSQ